VKRLGWLAWFLYQQYFKDMLFTLWKRDVIPRIKSPKDKDDVESFVVISEWVM
jgi:hypothetical protein